MNSIDHFKYIKASFLKAPKQGFSLIELLVAMALLSILVVMMTTLFNNSITAFNIGTQRTEMNMAARAALGYIARELSSAIAGDVDGVSGKSILFKIEAGPTDARFFTLTATNGSLFSSRMFCIRFDSPKNLLEAYHEQDNSPYNTTPSWQGGALLITNVLDFAIGIYSNFSDFTNRRISYTFDSTINPTQNLPVCADIVLELMASDDMKRYQTLSGAPKDEYRKRNARIYSTRIFFNNRHISVKNLKYE